MKIECQICTLEQAKKLKTLGVSQNSLFYHIDNVILGYEGVKMKINPIDAGVIHYYSAFTVAELGVMLPPGFDTMYCSNEGWRGYDAEGIDFKDVPYNTEAELRTDMIIAILEKFSDDNSYQTQINWWLQK